MLTATKDPFVILIGAMVSCWLGALSVEGLVRYTRCKEDSALGMVLSVYYGVGVLMLTAIQRSGNGARCIAIVTGTRYIHTVTESVDRGDLEATIALLAACLTSFD